MREIEREVITRNSVRCRSCGDEIESTHRHDFKWCSCKGVAVDGGRDYRRRVFVEEGTWDDTSVFTIEKIQVDW